MSTYTPVVVVEYQPDSKKWAIIIDDCPTTEWETKDMAEAMAARVRWKYKRYYRNNVETSHASA
jgi:hypothetical protein